MATPERFPIPPEQTPQPPARVEVPVGGLSPEQLKSVWNIIKIKSAEAKKSKTDLKELGSEIGDLIKRKLEKEKTTFNWSELREYYLNLSAGDPVLRQILEEVNFGGLSGAEQGRLKEQRRAAGVAERVQKEDTEEFKKWRM